MKENILPSQSINLHESKVEHEKYAFHCFEVLRVYTFTDTLRCFHYTQGKVEKCPRNSALKINLEEHRTVVYFHMHTDGFQRMNKQICKMT